MQSILGNEGRMAQAWIAVRGCLRVFAVYFWHSEGWTARDGSDGGSDQASQSHKAACDANMDLNTFEQGRWSIGGSKRSTGHNQSKFKGQNQGHDTVGGVRIERKPGRSKAEGGAEEEEKKEESSRRREEKKAAEDEIDASWKEICEEVLD